MSRNAYNGYLFRSAFLFLHVSYIYFGWDRKYLYPTSSLGSGIYFYGSDLIYPYLHNKYFLSTEMSFFLFSLSVYIHKRKRDTLLKLTAYCYCLTSGLSTDSSLKLKP